MRVVRAFNTATRRFREGDAVTEADGLGDWIARGFVAADAPAAEPEHAEPAEHAEH